MKLPFLRKFDHHMQEVLRGASTSFVLKALAAFLNIAFNVLLARLLGADGAGIYFLTLTVTTITAILGCLGIDNALLRFTAANVETEDWTAVKGVYAKGMQIALIVSVGMAVGMFLMAPLLAQVVFSKPELTGPLRWMALAVVPVSCSMLYAELLKGLKRIRYAISVESVWIPTFALFGALVLVPIWGVQGAVWAYILAAGLTSGIGLRLWHQVTPQLRGLTGYFDTDQLLSSSMPLFWVASLDIVVRWSPSLMLGIWSSSADVGIFGVAQRLAALINFVLIAVNSIAAPKFAALYRQGDIQTLGRIAKNSATLMALMASPILGLALFAPRWLMGIFGPQFADGAVIFSVLAVGQFVNVATGSVQFILMMCGYERLLRNVAVVCAIITVGLNVLLIPLWGVIGAAVAMTIVKIFQNLLLTNLVKQRLGIWTLPTLKRSMAVH